MVKKQKQGLSKLSAWKFGLAGGIVMAICMFITTVFAIYSPNAIVINGFLADIYGFVGLTVSWGGAFFSLLSFIDGFILTWVFALIYNKLL